MPATTPLGSVAESSIAPSIARKAASLPMESEGNWVDCPGAVEMDGASAIGANITDDVPSIPVIVGKAAVPIELTAPAASPASSFACVAEYGRASCTGRRRSGARRAIRGWSARCVRKRWYLS